MPAFAELDTELDTELDKEAKEHSTLVDKGIGEADQEVAKKGDGQEQRAVDEASRAAEKSLGGQQGGAAQSRPEA